MYGVLVGCAKYLQHYAGIKRSANVIPCAMPHEGPHDMLIQVKVQTSNGQGISAGGELLVNYGLTYDMDAKFGSQKRFRGALDEHFSTPTKTDPPKTDPPKIDPAPKIDAPKIDPPKIDPPKMDPPKKRLSTEAELLTAGASLVCKVEYPLALCTCSTIMTCT